VRSRGTSLEDNPGVWRIELQILHHHVKQDKVLNRTAVKKANVGLNPGDEKSSLVAPKSDSIILIRPGGGSRPR
jgi:hypothetical protein